MLHLLVYSECLSAYLRINSKIIEIRSKLGKQKAAASRIQTTLRMIEHKAPLPPPLIEPSPLYAMNPESCSAALRTMAWQSSITLRIRVVSVAQVSCT